MFYLNTPQIRELAVFTSMPAKYRQTGVPSAWANANKGGEAVDSFLEGPVFDDVGNLYVTDIPFGRVFRIDQQGLWDLVAQWDGEPNGMKFLNPKELLITDYKNGLVLLDIVSGKVRPYLERRNSERFKGVNDLTIAKNGDVYFTDQGQTGLHDPTGRVYRLGADGRLDVLLNNVPSPNGIVLSNDERFLFVAATRGNCVWRMPLLGDGSVSKAGQFFTSYGSSGPDGLAMNEGGQLLVANPGLGVVWVLNSKAEPTQVLREKSSLTGAGSSVTNIAFGGVDRKTLYATDSSHGTILQAAMSHAGARLHRRPAPP